MHPYFANVIAEQAHAERIRRAEFARGAQPHVRRRTIARRQAVRSAVGDLLVRSGDRLVSIGGRITTATSPPRRADSSSPSVLSGPEACIGC